MLRKGMLNLKVLSLGLVLLLAGCSGKAGTPTAGSNQAPGEGGVLPAVNLEGWSLPELPDTIPPEPANLRSVRERLAPFVQPLDPNAREASGVIKTLPNDSFLFTGAAPAPGHFNFRVSTPFNGQSPTEFTVGGNMVINNLSPQRYVQVGLVTNAVYNYAMDPDGNPLTSDANPAYLFNQSALMLVSLDQFGTAFAAPFDYNGKDGVGAAQAINPANFAFSLRFQPGGVGGGQVALKIDSGAYGPPLNYVKNNWGWWPDEDYSQVRLIVMAYSYSPAPVPTQVAFINVVADDPAYTPPPGGGTGAVQIDASNLANAKFSIWNPVGPTPYTGSLSTNTVYDATAAGTLLDGDQFFLQFELDPALAPNDLALYPPRVGGAAVCTVTPTGITLGGGLGTWFTVVPGTRTLQLKLGAFNRVVNNMAAGLPHAQYILRDKNTLATIGGPFNTNTSNMQTAVLADGVEYQPVFSALAYPAAGSDAGSGGQAEAIYPAEWPANWFTVGSASVSEGGSAVFPSMRDYFTQAGLTNTMDSDAFVRCEVAAETVVNAPLQFELGPAFSLMAGGFSSNPNPRNVFTVAKFLSFRAKDNMGNTSSSITANAGRLLGASTVASLGLGVGNGVVVLQVIGARVCDDPASPDPHTTIAGTSPWNAALSFLLQYGAPNYTVQLDGDFGTAWNDGIQGRIYSLSGSPYLSSGFQGGTSILNNSSPNTVKFALRVTDGAASQHVYVWPTSVLLPASGWTPSLPRADQSSSDAGWYARMAIVNGNPAVAYHDFTNEDVKFVRALDPNGADWGTPVIVDGAGATGWLPSLAVISGNPAVTYVPVGGGPLRYKRATDANGTAWGATVTAHPSSGLSSALLEVDGNPAAVFWAGSSVRYVRGTDSTGSAWGAEINLGGSSSYIPGPIPQVSMAIVNGNPAAAWHNGGDAVFCRASDVTGSAWPAAVVADNGGGAANVGAHPSLAVINGNPAICSYDYSNSALRYVRASNANGSAWPASIIVENAGDCGLFPSLAEINGFPAVSYWNQTNDDMMYIVSSNANGSSWPASGTVVDADECGDWSTLLLVNGQPGISYYSQTGGDLRFYRYY